MMADLVCVYLILSAVSCAGMLYASRALTKGRVFSARVQRQDATILLGAPAMEGAHWVLGPLARAVANLGVSANAISWASLFFGAAAGYFLSQGAFGKGALAALAAALMDVIDGMVARLTGTASEAGEVVDAVMDRFVEFFFFAGLIIYYRERPELVACALAALFGSLMMSYSTAKAETFAIKLPPTFMRRPERLVYLLLGATLSGFTVYYFEPRGAAVGYPMAAALVLVAVLSNYSSVKRFAHIVKALNEREL